MCNVKPEDRTSTEELKTRLKLKSVRELLQDRKLQWFGHLERMEERACSSTCRNFKISGSFPRGRPRNTWSEVIRTDLKEKKVSKDIAKDKSAWKPSNQCKHGKQKLKRML